MIKLYMNLINIRMKETAMLGWWHLKNFSPLGDCLPDVSVIDSKGDLIFQVVLTNDLMADVSNKRKERIS